MVNAEIRLIIFFTTKDGEAPYGQQKQAWVMTVAQIMVLIAKFILKFNPVATGLEKVSFHSNYKERQCQRMLKLPHNCTHLIP